MHRRDISLEVEPPTVSVFYTYKILNICSRNSKGLDEMTVQVAKLLCWSGGTLQLVEGKNRVQDSWASIKAADAVKRHRSFLLLQKQDTCPGEWTHYSFLE